MAAESSVMSGEMYNSASAATAVVHGVNLGSSIQQQKACNSTSSDPEDSGSNVGVCCYRSQLEQEVKKLQKQLQEEIDLHMVLANVAGHNGMHSFNCSCKIPDKAKDLLATIAALEITVTKLEEELATLHLRLSYERNECHLSESELKYLSSLEPSYFTSSYTWEEHIASLRNSKLSGCQQDLSSRCWHSQPYTVNRSSDKCTMEEISRLSGAHKEGRKMDTSLQQSDTMDFNKYFLMKKLWQHPNQLSEEMVRCMSDIFLCLSEPSAISSKVPSSEFVPSPSSPIGHLSRSSLTSFSDSSTVPSLMRSPSPELYHHCEVMELEYIFDPYGVNRKANWKNIGSYSLAAEVSWMSIGKVQLEYAAEGLKKFRFLVEQLQKVNPALMGNNERLAFWINLYNALIMHAYLAYGVPRSDMKLFSLMQKVSYTVGGQSFSAADIEFVILKMKPPAHRPQIALILALHKFKVSEEHKKYSVDSSEPLAMFALSCGMYSSPAVRIFTAGNVHEELEIGIRDYIRASIGINEKGKLLVPRLLHSYARGVVEDSLLVDWICRFLTPDQVSIVRDSTSHQWKQRLLGARSFSLVPFDSRFRYLFLPDSRTHGQQVLVKTRELHA